MGNGIGRRFFLAFSAFCLVAMSLQPVQVQAQGVLTVVATGLTGRQLLDDAEKRVNVKMVEVQNFANGLAAQAITGLTMSIQSARINGDALLDRPLSELKDTERAVFTGIREATARLDALTDMAYRLEEVTAVDASMVLGAIPLVEKATFISSIRGLSILKTRPEHKVIVIGTGLGPANDKLSGKLEIWNGNKLLVPSRVDNTDRNTTTLYFPTSMFESYFRANEVVTLPLTIKLSTVRSRWYWSDLRGEVATKALFTLYPPAMGVAQVVAEVPTFAWVQTYADSKSWTMKDCGNSKCGDGGVREDMTHAPGVEGDTPVVGYRRLTGVSCSCGMPWWAKEACEYSRPLTCEIADNAKQVKHSWQVTGIWGTRTARYNVETYQRTGTQTLSLPPISLVYGEEFSFCVPANADLYRIQLRTLTKETFNLTPAESVGTRVQYVSNFSCNATEKRYLYRVTAPT